MADVYFVGNVVGGSCFGMSDIICRWKVVTGQGWKLIEGVVQGVTQAARPAGSDCIAAWAHPIDIHFLTPAVEGWPRLVLEVVPAESIKQESQTPTVLGYGVIALPTSPGYHEIDIETWIPANSGAARMRAQLFGTGEGFPDGLSVILDSQERSRLATVPGGIVHVELTVVGNKLDQLGLIAEN